MFASIAPAALTRRLPRAASVFSSLALLGLSTLCACTSLPARHGATVQTSSTGKLEQHSPIDVVVAPVENTSGNAKAPVAALRQTFHRGLVKRRYSPLALDYVDRKIGEAAYRPGTLQEQAVLQITLERWDTSLWEMQNAVLVKLNARMLDAENPTGGELWSGAVDRRFDFANEREQFATHDALVRHVCEKIATEILAALPARNPTPGYLPGSSN